MLKAQIEWGVTPCCLCGHPLQPGDRVQLDHGEGGDDDYRGLAHSSPCQICDRRCNQADGGERAAMLAGKQSRRKRCTVCGLPFTASRSSDGAKAVTCGRQDCINAVRAARRAREPDPQPPPPSGWVWLPFSGREIRNSPPRFQRGSCLSGFSPVRASTRSDQ